VVMVIQSPLIVSVRVGDYLCVCGLQVVGFELGEIHVNGKALLEYKKK